MHFSCLSLILMLTLFTSLSQAQVHPLTRMVLFGGGAMPPDATKLAVKWGQVTDAASGKKINGKLLIIGFPSTIPQDYFESIGREFKTQAGFLDRNITTIESIKSAKDRSRFIKLFNEASMVYMTGGDQVRAMEVFKTWGLLRFVREGIRNKVYLGKSAGTASTASLAISGNTTAPIEALGLVDAIVDTHFLKRDRPFRLKKLMRETGKRYGIGIDEDGALAFDGNYATAIGEKDMMFYELKYAGVITEFQLTPGRVFNLTDWHPAPLMTLGCGNAFGN